MLSYEACCVRTLCLGRYVSTSEAATHSQAHISRGRDRGTPELEPEDTYLAMTTTSSQGTPEHGICHIKSHLACASAFHSFRAGFTVNCDVSSVTPYISSRHSPHCALSHRPCPPHVLFLTRSAAHSLTRQRGGQHHGSSMHSFALCECWWLGARLLAHMVLAIFWASCSSWFVQPLVLTQHLPCHDICQIPTRQMWTDIIT